MGIINVGNVIELIPTNIILIETNDLEVDFLCLLEDETNKMLEVIEMTPLYEEITKRSQEETLDNVFKAIELLKEHKAIDYIAEKTHLPKERIILLKRQIQQ